MTLVFGIVAGVGVAGALALSAFKNNVTFFFDPSKVAAGQVKAGQHFRLGGMVVKGSVKREPGSLEVHFVVTDFSHDVPVTYSKVLPDLFREGTGVVANGQLRSDGTFVADEVLAKHDEKYMPPEVAKSLKRRHGEAREEALNETPSAPAAGSTGQSAAAAGEQAPQAGTPQSPSTTSTFAPRDSGTQADVAGSRGTLPPSAQANASSASQADPVSGRGTLPPGAQANASSASQADTPGSRATQPPTAQANAGSASRAGT
jgi:cytochrome c-type biogenesis protein CcmE